MFRIITLNFLLLFAKFSFANRYQVDMILFTHSQTQTATNASSPLLLPNTKSAIPLQNEANQSTALYHILPASLSQLRSEYSALSRKPEYQILAHYSWIQPSNNQRPIAFSAHGNAGWNVEGTLRIRQSNYYLLDTDLLFSSLGQAQTTFNFSQVQRLKPGTVYYLDHPQAGMLIKVHALS